MVVGLKIRTMHLSVWPKLRDDACNSTCPLHIIIPLGWDRAQWLKIIRTDGILVLKGMLDQVCACIALSVDP